MTFKIEVKIQDFNKNDNNHSTNIVEYSTRESDSFSHKNNQSRAAEEKVHSVEGAFYLGAIGKAIGVRLEEIVASLIDKTKFNSPAQYEGVVKQVIYMNSDIKNRFHNGTITICSCYL